MADTHGKTQPFLIFGSPLIEQAEIDEVVACMESSWLGTGPRVARFERDFAAYQGLQPAQVAAVNSCTAALHVSMVALDLPPGSEVITTPMTFCATVNAIIHAGLTPVLADVDPATQNIDPAAIEAAITPRTRAILPVHFAGRACAMDAIMAIAAKHNLKVIEDCAHAIETTYHGRKAGTFGDFGCFSFYATKNVVTGEGGMIAGRSEAHIARTRVLALHGMSKDAWHRFGDEGYKHYQVVEAGFKYNMMDLQAAIGIHQLARVERNWKRREAIWNRYMDAFKDLPIGLPAPVAQAALRESAPSPLPLSRGERGSTSPESSLRGSAPSPLPLSRGEGGSTLPESPTRESAPSPLRLSRGERGSTSPESSLRGSVPSPLPLSRGERGSTSPESSTRESVSSPLPLSRGERGSRHAYHLFTIMVDEARCGISRDGFLDAMNKRRIGTGVHYLSIPEHPYYQQRYGWRPERWPNAMRIGRQTVSLPLSPKLSDADVTRVIDTVREVAT